jgi:hypothetical protein
MRLDDTALQVTANRLQSRLSAVNFEIPREIALASGKVDVAALVGAEGLRASQQAALEVELDYRPSRLAVLDAETGLAEAELSRLLASETTLRQELVACIRPPAPSVGRPATSRSLRRSGWRGTWSQFWKIRPPRG